MMALSVAIEFSVKNLCGKPISLLRWEADSFETETKLWYFLFVYLITLNILKYLFFQCVNYKKKAKKRGMHFNVFFQIFFFLGVNFVP